MVVVVYGKKSKTFSKIWNQSLKKCKEMSILTLALFLIFLTQAIPFQLSQWSVEWHFPFCGVSYRPFAGTIAVQHIVQTVLLRLSCHPSIALNHLQWLLELLSSLVLLLLWLLPLPMIHHAPLPHLVWSMRIVLMMFRNYHPILVPLSPQLD